MFTRHIVQFRVEQRREAVLTHKSAVSSPFAGAF